MKPKKLVQKNRKINKQLKKIIGNEGNHIKKYRKLPKNTKNT